MVEKWRTISSKYLHKEDWFTIRVDECETAEGKRVYPYYVYEFPDWASAVAITEDNQVLMIKQYRHALDVISLEIPGGVIDKEDESVEAGVRRELLEETGYVFKELEFLTKISPNPATNTNYMHIFLARGGRKVQDPKLDHNEDIDVLLFSIDEVKQLLKDHQIVQSLHTTALFYALNRLGELHL